MVLEAVLDSIKGDFSIKRIVSGLRFNAVLSRNCGIAASLHRDTPHLSAKFEFKSCSTMELAKLSCSSDIEKASLGVAALNSLIKVDEARCSQDNASEIIKKHGRNKNVSIIGHFPFTEDLKPVAQNLWVMEKNKKPGDFSEEDAEKYLPLSHVVAISGTTLINHTIERLLELCPAESVVLVLGGSSPLSPVLFDFGIDYISGCRIMDAEAVFPLIAGGATFREIKKSGKVRLLTMAREKIKGG